MFNRLYIFCLGVGALPAASLVFASLTSPLLVQARNPAEAALHFQQGIADMNGNNLGKAVNEFEAALRLDANSLDARYALSAACWKLGDREGAIQLLRQVVKQNPSFAAEAHYNLGLELKQAGDLDEAARELSASIRLEPRSAKPYLALCQVQTEKQDLEGALATARKAVELVPDDPETNYDLAEALRLKGDMAGAAEQFARVLQLDAGYPGAHRQLGLTLRQQGKDQAAAAEFQKAILVNNEDAKAQYYLGTTLLRLNDAEQAAVRLNEAWRLNPYDSGTHIALAAALNRLGKTGDAQQELKKAQDLKELEANAGRSRVLLGSAVEHLKKDDAKTALNELRQAAALSPEYPEVQLQLALALHHNHAPSADVEKTLRRAIELNPDDAEAFLQLGLLLQSNGKKTDASDEFRRALDMAPSLVEAHRALARAALDHHDWALAATEFGDILIWKPDDVEARRGLFAASSKQSALRNRPLSKKLPSPERFSFFLVD